MYDDVCSTGTTKVQRQETVDTPVQSLSPELHIAPVVTQKVAEAQPVAVTHDDELDMFADTPPPRPLMQQTSSTTQLVSSMTSTVQSTAIAAMSGSDKDGQPSSASNTLQGSSLSTTDLSFVEKQQLSTITTTTTTITTTTMTHLSQGMPPSQPLTSKTSVLVDNWDDAEGYYSNGLC